MPLTHDLFATDVQGRSAYYYARTVLYSNSSNEKSQEIVCRKILDRCAEEAGGDTILHRTIFGETPLSLADAIALDPTAINVADRNGFTPLHWACLRTDIDALAPLLQAGADVDARDFLGRTPLLLGIKCDRTDLLEPLIAAGADINAPTRTGMTPLFEAVRQNAAGVFEFLLRRGATSPPRASDGVGIHHCLTPYEREVESTRMCDLMIEYGYDINAVCKRGWSPLFYSLWFDDPIGVKAMLPRGADVGVIDAAGKTMLHMVAEHCSWEVMEALEGWVDVVNAEARDEKGMTAEQYFKERMMSTVKGSRPVTEKDEVAFGRLLAGISAFRRRDSGFDESWDGESEDEEGDSFYDTVEVM